MGSGVSLDSSETLNNFELTVQCVRYACSSCIHMRIEHKNTVCIPMHTFGKSPSYSSKAHHTNCHSIKRLSAFFFESIATQMRSLMHHI